MSHSKMCSNEDSMCCISDPNFIVNEKHVKIRVDVDGFSKHNLNVKCHGNTIKITAEKEENREDEIVKKNFNTSYDIPPGYDMSRISAKLSDRKLIIEVPVEHRNDGHPRNVVIH
ncbi:hypothetical protein WA026_003621 [Henosepilachna vigintioctopunctata]|uniref:SHSP domain-containing protein n=1 Tax=Henosepilachna vigintioctopunctata TaxID=420089 RepID=A0AAW1TP05_9CUCU